MDDGQIRFRSSRKRSDPGQQCPNPLYTAWMIPLSPFLLISRSTLMSCLSPWRMLQAPPTPIALPLLQMLLQSFMSSGTTYPWRTPLVRRPKGVHHGVLGLLPHCCSFSNTCFEHWPLNDSNLHGDARERPPNPTHYLTAPILSLTNCPRHTAYNQHKWYN